MHLFAGSGSTADPHLVAMAVGDGTMAVFRLVRKASGATHTFRDREGTHHVTQPTFESYVGVVDGLEGSVARLVGPARPAAGASVVFEGSIFYDGRFWSVAASAEQHDGSASITTPDWYQVRDFAVEIVNAFNVSAAGAEIGAVQFSSRDILFPIATK